MVCANKNTKETRHGSLKPVETDAESPVGMSARVENPVWICDVGNVKYVFVRELLISGGLPNRHVSLNGL